MKTNINIFNNLNESLEKEFEAKRKLKEADKVEIDKDGNKSIRDTKTGHLKKIIVSKKTQDKMADKHNKKLEETGEWDDNDEEMSAWLEDLRGQAKELADEISGEVKSVTGFDKYQGPRAIVHSPKHGDIEVWFDPEDDTGRSFNVKVAHVGWIQGGIRQLADLLNQDTIPENEIINESEDNDFYNYVKGLLDSGAIDDPKHYNSLSDKEKEDLIRNTWMKDKDVIKDYKKINESENIEPKVENANFYWLDNDTFIAEFDKETDEQGDPFNYMVEYWLDDNSFHFLKLYEYDTLEADFSEEKKTELMNIMKEKIKESKVNEEEIVRINAVETEPDYLIQDVTVLDQVGDGDVQSPDIEAMLTLVDSALKENYSENWGHIKTLSSKIDENSSYALVDISTPEILKEFESRGIKDAAIGKNLILEKVNNKLMEFKVNNLNGTTKYSKKTTNPQKAIYEWLESEFLQEAKEEKAKEAEVAKAKTEKETVENYINNRLDLKMEIENIKMFIDLSKEVKAQEEMKPAIQKRMYAFAVEVPHQIEVSNKDDKYELSFSNLDQVVEMVFGKEWIKETTPDNEVVGVIKESQKINEAYEQFNIGDIEVVFNPDTYETLYSIPSADVKDKKINLTKIPTVDTPYDTNTIIKSYIETRFGRIPSEEEKKMVDKGEISEPTPEKSEPSPEEEIPQDDINIEEPDLTEDELPDEPEENEIPTEPEEELPEAETGSAIFMKVRPKQSVSIEDLRNRQLDGDTPTSSYIVVDTLDLSPEEFNDLSSNLSEQRSYLEGIQALDRKNYSFNVIKITSRDSNYDLLIDPLGYNYPRYVAISDKA